MWSQYFVILTDLQELQCSVFCGWHKVLQEVPAASLRKYCGHWLASTCMSCNSKLPQSRTSTSILAVLPINSATYTCMSCNSKLPQSRTFTSILAVLPINSATYTIIPHLSLFTYQCLIHASLINSITQSLLSIHNATRGTTPTAGCNSLHTFW